MSDFKHIKISISKPQMTRLMRGHTVQLGAARSNTMDVMVALSPREHKRVSKALTHGKGVRIQLSSAEVMETSRLNSSDIDGGRLASGKEIARGFRKFARDAKPIVKMIGKPLIQAVVPALGAAAGSAVGMPILGSISGNLAGDQLGKVIDGWGMKQNARKFGRALLKSTKPILKIAAKAAIQKALPIVQEALSSATGQPELSKISTTLLATMADGKVDGFGLLPVAPSRRRVGPIKTNGGSLYLPGAGLYLPGEK